MKLILSFYLAAFGIAMPANENDSSQGRLYNQYNSSGKKKLMAVDANVQRRAKSKAKNGKRKKADKKNVFSHDDNNMCSIEDFIGVSTYEGGGTCDKTFQVTIECNDGRTLCTFEEESVSYMSNMMRSILLHKFHASTFIYSSNTFNIISLSCN